MFWNYAPLTQALIIFGTGLVLGAIARLIILRLGRLILGALGLSQWDYSPIRSIAWLAYAWLVVFAVYLGLQRLPLDRVQDWWVDRITAALIILLVAGIIRIIANAVIGHYTRRAARRGATAGTLNLLRKIAQVVIVLVAFLLVLEQFNYRFTAVLAGLGLVSLGVGLALQDTLANFFAGLWLSVDRPLTRGDYIELESGQAGWVQEVGWRFSRLATWDENYLIVPNSRLASAVFINNTGRDGRTSLFLEARASYDADLDLVERVALDVAYEVRDEVEGMDTSFEPVVLFRAFDDSYIRFSVGFYILTRETRRVAISEFIRKLKRRFAEEGLRVSYPVTEVRLQDVPELTLSPG